MERLVLSIRGLTCLLLAVFICAPSVATAKDDGIWERIRGGFRVVDEDLIRHPQVQRQIKTYTRKRGLVEGLLGYGRPFLHHVMEEVERQGLPAEMALLPYVESSYSQSLSDVRTISWQGAQGLWQITRPTGISHMKMRIDCMVDERRDVRRATVEALRYLKSLSVRFKGHWTLAVAAYNVGPTKLSRAVREAGGISRVENVFSLKLVDETNWHARRLLALAEIIRNPSKYGVTLPTIPDAPYFNVVTLPRPANVHRLARLLNTDQDELLELNGHLRTWGMSSVPPHQVLLPARATKRLTDILSRTPNIDLSHYVTRFVKEGEAIGVISEQQDVCQSELMALNNLSSPEDLQAGQALKIPAARRRHRGVRLDCPVHVVREGDTLWEIARTYGTTIRKIVESSRRSVKEALRPGERLVLCVDNQGALGNVINSR